MIVYECGDASGSKVLPDEPLCAVPVETFGSVTDTWKMNTCFVWEKDNKG